MQSIIAKSAALNAFNLTPEQEREVAKRERAMWDIHYSKAKEDTKHRLAAANATEIGGETESALQLMLINDGESVDGEWTEKQLKAREEIYACQTKGALRQMLMPFFGAGTVGRPKGSLGETGLTHITDKELCERLWGNVANAFAPIDRLCATVREMDYQRCQYYISTLQNALAALKAHKEKLEG